MARIRTLWAKRRGQVIVGTTAILVAGVLGLWAVRTHPAIDERWLTEVMTNRGPWRDALSLMLNSLGGGVIGVFVVPIAVTLALWRWRGRLPALYFLAASAASALVVQVMKAAFDRPRPEQLLIAADQGSFPSGHTANAATIAVALGLLFPRRWVWAVGAGYTVLMALSRVYLGAHWLTDTLGGMLVGAGVAVLVWAGFGRRLANPAAVSPTDLPARSADSASEPSDSATEPGDHPGGLGQ